MTVVCYHAIFLFGFVMVVRLPHLQGIPQVEVHWGHFASGKHQPLWLLGVSLCPLTVYS